MKKMCLFVTLTLLSVSSVLGEQFNHVYKILEEQEIGTVLGTTVAQDTNLHLLFNEEESRRLRYSISSQGNVADEMFTINESTSEIKTIKMIDRETECPNQQKCEIHFDVMVYIQDSNTDLYDIHSIVRLTVVIEDMNDNAPTFTTTSVLLTVPESIAVDQTLITSPAYDLDTGVNNSVQTYVMIPDEGVFELRVKENVGGNSDLEIVIKRPLDREQQEKYDFTIVAKDGGKPKKTGTLAVTIQVTDVNDNTPLFTKQTFEVTVSEDIPLNMAILKLEANDGDADLNGAMSFHFNSRTSEKNRNYFSIDEQTGEIYPIRELDYEDETQYRFLVNVKDKGSSPRSSQAEVIINVADVNDNAPQIIVKVPGGVREISEAAENNTFIAHVNILDADSNENGEVDCTVSDNHFRAEKFTFQYYKILLKKSLDYEEADTFVVNITCTDKGTVPKSNSTTFTVKVLDVNDNAPVFPYKNYTAYVTENNNPDQMIMSMTAVDRDGNGNNKVSYAIMEDSKDLVYINTESGEIRIKKSINREDYSSFRFKVEARDDGSPAMSSFAMVTVVVDDVNDEAPTFTKPHFEFEFPEGRPIRSVVGILKALDKDATPNFVYSLMDDEVADVFTIGGDTGEILTLRKLDRLVQNKYDFSVIVRDPEILSFNDTANVTVYVTEDRSIPPTILYPVKGNNSVVIPNDVAIGFTIIFIRAETMASENRKVKFLIEHGNEDNFFQLDENSGNLTIAKVPRLQDAGRYKLLISTYYENNPSQKSFITLNIIISGSVPTEDDNQSYIIIVVVIVCVTVVLAGAILLAICMMKRVDRERRESHRRRKEEMEKVYNMDNIEKMASASNWEKDDNLHVMVKPQLSVKEEKPPEKAIKRDAVDGIAPTVIPKKIVQFADHPVIKVEDDVSNLSAEADSGHGGSEEDFNSNGRYLFLHTDSDSSQQLSPCESFDFRPETSILSSSSLKEWLVETPRRVNLPHRTEELHRSYSPVPETYRTERETAHENYSTPRKSPARKTSSRGSQKSVRFNVEDSDI